MAQSMGKEQTSFYDKRGTDAEHVPAASPPLVGPASRENTPRSLDTNSGHRDTVKAGESLISLYGTLDDMEPAKQPAHHKVGYLSLRYLSPRPMIQVGCDAYINTVSLYMHCLLLLAKLESELVGFLASGLVQFEFELC